MDYLFVKLCVIENKINEKNAEYFKVILHTQKLAEMIVDKEFLDIKECLLDLTIYDITKCIKNSEKLQYRFTKYGVENPTLIYEIEYSILDEIKSEIIKELEL